MLHLTYELVVVCKACIGLPEALLLNDRWQIPKSLVSPVVQLGQARPGSALYAQQLC